MKTYLSTLILSLAAAALLAIGGCATGDRAPPFGASGDSSDTSESSSSVNDDSVLGPGV